MLLGTEPSGTIEDVKVKIQDKEGFPPIDNIAVLVAKS